MVRGARPPQTEVDGQRVGLCRRLRPVRQTQLVRVARVDRFLAGVDHAEVLGVVVAPAGASRMVGHGMRIRVPGGGAPAGSDHSQRLVEPGRVRAVVPVLQPDELHRIPLVVHDDRAVEEEHGGIRGRRVPDLPADGDAECRGTGLVAEPAGPAEREPRVAESHFARRKVGADEVDQRAVPQRLTARVPRRDAAVGHGVCGGERAAGHDAPAFFGVGAGVEPDGVASPAE